MAKSWTVQDLLDELAFQARLERDVSEAEMVAFLRAHGPKLLAELGPVLFALQPGAAASDAGLLDWLRYHARPRSRAEGDRVLGDDIVLWPDAKSAIASGPEVDGQRWALEAFEVGLRTPKVLKSYGEETTDVRRSARRVVGLTDKELQRKRLPAPELAFWSAAHAQAFELQVAAETQTAAASAIRIALKRGTAFDLLDALLPGWRLAMAPGTRSDALDAFLERQRSEVLSILGRYLWRIRRAQTAERWRRGEARAKQDLRVEQLHGGRLLVKVAELNAVATSPTSGHPSAMPPDRWADEVFHDVLSHPQWLPDLGPSYSLTARAAQRVRFLASEALAKSWADPWWLAVLARADYLAEPDGPTAVLIGCGTDKREEPARAVDLYIGSLYQTHLDLLRSAGLVPTHILSALHAAIPAYQVVAPYKMEMPEDEFLRKEWGRRVLEQLRPVAGSKWLVLAGAPYVDSWIGEARRLGVEVFDPLRGADLFKRRNVAKTCRNDRACARKALGLS